MRQGTMVIGIWLLMATLFCGAVMSAPVPPHQSTGSVTPEDLVEVPLGQSTVLSCQLHLPPGSLEQNCVIVQTKDTREKNTPLFPTGPEKEVEVLEQVLLYLRKGQEKPEFQSPLYRNRTSRWDGGDVSVQLWNVSVRDNNTVFQCFVTPGCQEYVLKREITLRTVERTDGVNQNPTVTVTAGVNQNPTVIVTAVVVPVLLLLGAIAVRCVCTRIKRSKSAAGANQDATEGGAMGAVENGVMGKPTEESVGNQDQPDGPVVMTEDQPNGSLNRDQDQPNGSTTYLKKQQHQQSGSAESTAAPEQEPLLRNEHSRGEDGRGGPSDQDRALSEQETLAQELEESSSNWKGAGSSPTPPDLVKVSLSKTLNPSAPDEQVGALPPPSVCVRM
ncbi:uncharacterized protein LOC121697466 [Alosa sapidissima]|uniref:uncharacterized protein LOC121697466 n=1 Tax=Alosa sapidissima TaxID=34773 RepID=UPI001C097469|nr:uncharacterized protein LOC121697466 [Alosa sapidissima]